MSIVFKVPKFFTEPLGIYLFGVFASVFLNGHYHCAKEFEEQKNAKNLDMGKVLDRSLYGVCQGFIVGSLWPVLFPTFISNYLWGNKKIENK